MFPTEFMIGYFIFMCVSIQIEYPVFLNRRETITHVSSEEKLCRINQNEHGISDKFLVNASVVLILVFPLVSLFSHLILVAKLIR